jgi:hypothetical protein
MKIITVSARLILSKKLENVFVKVRISCIKVIAMRIFQKISVDIIKYKFAQQKEKKRASANNLIKDTKASA